jgi:hypothetical protein
MGTVIGSLVLLAEGIISFWLMDGNTWHKQQEQPVSSADEILVAQPQKPHHGLEYALAAFALFVETLAVFFGFQPLSLGAAILAWFAVFEYSKHSGGWVRKYVLSTVIAVLIVVGTFILAAIRNHPQASIVSTPPPTAPAAAAGSVGAQSTDGYKSQKGTSRIHQAAPEVTLDSHLQPPSYPTGFVFAGIVWDEGYSDVRLDISVGKVAIHDLDFLVQVDTTIMGAGQITQFPGCTQFPPSGNLSAFTILGTDGKGKNIAIPAEPTPGNLNAAPTYRVHCDEMFANVTVRFAIATRALNPPKTDGSLPDHLFATRRDPKFIRVDGSYKSAGVMYPLKYSAKLEKAPE